MDDKEILQLFADDKNAAMKALLAKYHQAIYFHIRHILISHDDANDVSQEVFIKVWQKMDKFRGESSIYSWIYRIATNESLNFIRKNKKHKLFQIEDDTSYLQERISTDPWISGDKIQIRLINEIAKLPKQQRIIFNMRYFEELKFKDIAQILKLSEGGVKASYHVAEKKIKESLQDN